MTPQPDASPGACQSGRTKPRKDGTTRPAPKAREIDLSDVLADDDPEPCVECTHRARCALGEACSAFGRWTVTGKVDPTARRVPTAWRYHLLFEAEE